MRLPPGGTVTTGVGEPPSRAETKVGRSLPVPGTSRSCLEVSIVQGAPLLLATTMRRCSARAVSFGVAVDGAKRVKPNDASRTSPCGACAGIW